MVATRIYLPCDVVGVVVRFRYGSSLSNMESVALRIIATERPGGRPWSLGDLEHLLCLGRKVTFELVFDLLRRGYITLDLTNDEVMATAEVLAHLRNRTFGELAGAEQSRERIEVMIDRLSGHVGPPGGSRTPLAPRLAFPAEGTGDVADDEVRGAPLLRAIDQTMRIRREQRTVDEPEGVRTIGAATTRSRGVPTRHLEVLEAHLESRAGRRMVERRWMPLDVRVVEDPDTGRLRVRVVGGDLPTDRRERVAARIAQFAEDRPDHDFVRALRAASERDDADAPSLAELVRRLEHDAAAASTAPAGSRRQLHLQLADTARRAEEQLRLDIAAEVNARVVGGFDEHQQAVKLLIERARHQLVLACPVLHGEAIRPLMPALESAVRREVKVILLWGSRHGEEIPEAVLNRLFYLAELEMTGGRPHFLFSQQPCRSNASIVVADDRHALVTGFPFLAEPSSRRVAPLGIRIDAARQGPCAPVESLLQWARDRAPDYLLGKAFTTRHADFPAQVRATPDESEDPYAPLEALARMVPEAPPDDEDPTVAARARTWAQAWVHHGRALKALLAARTLPQAHTVENGAHRDLLWHGLRRAERRLVISADQLAQEVVKRPFAGALEQRLEAGVQVRIVHRGSSSRDPNRPDPRMLLDDLAARFPAGRCEVARVEASARAFVSDNETVVGSFDFLSHKGFYASQGGRRLRAELGLWLTGERIADDVAAAVGAPATPPTPRRTPLPEAAGERANRPAPAEDLLAGGAGAADALLGALAAAPDANLAARSAIIRDAVLAVPTPWQLLATLRDAAVDKEVLRIAVAAALRGRLLDSNPQVATWAQWLLQERWSEHAFLEAWLVRRVLVDEGLRPRRALARVAALRRSPMLPDLVVEASLDDPLPPERVALLVTAVTDLVLGARRAGEADGSSKAGAGAGFLAEGLDVLIDEGGVAAAWLQLAEAARRHHHDVGEPLLLDEVELAIGQEDHLRLVGQTWVRLHDALEQAQQNAFTFESGIKTHAHLFHEDGIFGKLRPLAAARDVHGLREWLRTPRLDDLGKLVDRVTQEVHPGGELISGRRRRLPYLERLRAVVTAARAAHREASATASDLVRLERSRPFAREVAKLWPELRAELAQVEEPERFLVELSLDELATVARWGDG
jgi:hypothetical protein